MIEKYGAAPQFLATFTPDCQIRYTTNKRRCYRGYAPEIALVGRTYGARVAEAWLMNQLHELGEYTGCKDKQTERQKEDTARVIISEFGFLKVTEFMHFFVLFKSGRFGKFYGSVDAITITTALREYLKVRDAELDQILHAEMKEQQAEEQKHRDRNSITFEEYQELKWLYNMGYEPRHLNR